jgi:hypothetical protein
MPRNDPAGLIISKIYKYKVFIDFEIIKKEGDAKNISFLKLHTIKYANWQP